MATYHGLVKAKCLICGTVTSDDTEVELWNDLAVACACSSDPAVVKWWNADGSVTITESDSNNGDLLAIYTRSTVVLPEK